MKNNQQEHIDPNVIIQFDKVDGRQHQAAQLNKITKAIYTLCSLNFHFWKAAPALWFVQIEAQFDT